MGRGLVLLQSTMDGERTVPNWSGTGVKELQSHTQRCLKACSLRTLKPPQRGEAAVVMPIFERDGEAHFLLTLRTQEVATHKGEISFPGGLREGTDATLHQTALREMEEEVGIEDSHVEVVGPFHQYLSKTHFSVTPFVAFLNEGFTVSPNPREVARIVEVPLDFFRRTRPRREVRQRVLYFYDYRGEVIWGLTAAMIKDFVELLDNPDYSQ